MNSPTPDPTAAAAAPPAAQNPAAARPERLVSLDAFRGFTMFWLLGGHAFFHAVAAWTGIEILAYELRHSPWEGLRYYDLVWPSFMLMVGMAIPFSFARRTSVQSQRELMRSVWKRAAVLFLLGSIRESLSQGEPVLIELSSALQPIAVAYLVTSHLAGYGLRVQIGTALGILAGYTLLLAFVPAPGISTGSYERGANLVTAVDLAVLGRTHPGGWGTVLSTIPTIASTIAGLLVGRVLLSSAGERTKAGILALAGVGCLAAGLLLSPVVPIIMKLWTTSYALVSTGWACLLFLAFYWIVDVLRWRRWTFPLAVIGVNALAAYLLPAFLPLGRIVGTFTNPIAQALGTFGPVFSTGAVLFAGWLILLWLHRHKIYLKA